jgi:putative effector of murein hydrolase LrgA (UPF0299 family)
MSEAESQKTSTALNFIAGYYISNFFGVLRETLFDVDQKLWRLIERHISLLLLFASVGVVFAVGLLFQRRWAKIATVASSGILLALILSGFIVGSIQSAVSDWSFHPPLWGFYSWPSAAVNSVINGSIVWLLTKTLWFDRKKRMERAATLNQSQHGESPAETKSLKRPVAVVFIAAYFLSNFVGAIQDALFYVDQRMWKWLFEATEFAILFVVSLGVVAGIALLLRKKWATVLAIVASGMILAWTINDLVGSLPLENRFDLRTYYEWVLAGPFGFHAKATMVLSMVINLATVSYLAIEARRTP